MNSIYLVLKNMTRAKLRLALTLFATCIAFFVYGVLSSFQSALGAGVDLAADDRLVVLNKINFTQPLPISYANKLETVENIAESVHMNWFGGYYQEPRKQFGMFAVQTDTFLAVYDELILTDEEKSAWINNRQGLIAGASVAELHGWKVGDRIPINSNIFSQSDGSTAWDFDVVAIYRGADKQTDASSVYFHYEYFNETQSFGRDFIGWFGVRTTSPDKNEQVINDIDALFANTPYETESMPEKAFNQAFIAQIGNIGLILSSVVLAAFFIILVIVGNSMALAIRERTREIGVLKTLGFKSSKLFSMVLGESMGVALIGGGIGLFLAWIVTGILNEIPQLPAMALNSSIAIKAVGIMLLLGFITGIVPAISAMRMNIVSALSRN